MKTIITICLSMHDTGGDDDYQSNDVVDADDGHDYDGADEFKVRTMLVLMMTTILCLGYMYAFPWHYGYSFSFHLLFDQSNVENAI